MYCFILTCEGVGDPFQFHHILFFYVVEHASHAGSLCHPGYADPIDASP